MNIIEAVKEAMEGKKIRRKEWFFISEDDCVYVAGVLNLNGEISHLCKFGIGREHVYKEIATFLDIDVLADDWEVVK